MPWKYQDYPPEQDSQSERVIKGQLDQGKRNRSDRTELPSQDCQNRTTRTGQSEQDSRYRTAGQDSKKNTAKTARTGLPVLGLCSARTRTAV